MDNGRFTMSEIRRQSHNKRVNGKSLWRMLIWALIIGGLILYYVFATG